ncbi:MAG TPA: nicotinamide-nucleotide amidohydrolase family protein [Nordella sp.]|nr:nicotinamide-nucleotide amidohydrolase family protein [Nordella sp.]
MSLFAPALLAKTEALLRSLRQRQLMLCTAESCTGGLIAGLLTEIAGSSDVVERGFVVYSNDAKMSLLGVPASVIELHGAVSEVCARAMAEGALKNSKADIAISVTGIAGPGGGSAEKPVGLVHFGCASRHGPTAHRRFVFENANRGEVRLRSVTAGLDLVRAQLETTTRLA